MRAASVDRLANLVFSICCVALLGAGAVRYRAAAPVHAAREHVLAAGSPDPFAVTIAEGTRPRVYVFVSASCQPCRDSLPFYRRLLNVDARAIVIFVGLEPEPQIVEFLRLGGIGGARVASVLRPGGIPGTPSVVAVDTSRRVQASWAGRLGPAQERDVIAFVRSGVNEADRSFAADAEPVLARARSTLDGIRQIDSVTGLEISGTETLLRDAGTRVDPYAFTLGWPDRLELRVGPVLHTLSGTTYTRRLADPNRFGGPMLDRLMDDPRIVATATSGMRWHLLRLSLTYLARAPASVTAADEGLRDYGQLKGRTIGFRDAAGRLQAELVLDPSTLQPLGLAAAVHNIGGTEGESTLISLFGDYRQVSGVRVPHRIDEWNGFNHSRIELTTVKVVAR